MGLFSHMAGPERRKEGILPSQEIRELIRSGKIRARVEISDDQIQPASIDLRLGNAAYQVRASFLPSVKSLISARIRELLHKEIDLSQPALLSPGCVFIVPLIENLALPSDMSGKANPKSTTGRLDIFTRLMTEGAGTFEVVPEGYSGDLYVEIVPRTFPVIVRAGMKLNQVRFFRGNPQFDDEKLRRLAHKGQLVYAENGDGPTKPVIREGLRVSIDLQGDERESIVAYRAKKQCSPIDLARIGAYDVAEFWDPLQTRDLKGGLVLDPSDFYLLASKERVGVPPEYAAEMEQYDPSIGEFSVHYAGFFDPGFGYGKSGEIKGTKAVLEVRAHEVPILLEDRQEVGRLMYLKMAAHPDKLYGQGIGSSYQQQGLALSKQFKTTSKTELAAHHTSTHSQDTTPPVTCP
ncbi:MAG TPA: 2'-deoxycytidine 5'-triphosphate deaminase [Terriglobia bacterium]|nr:2'-deoxycytidine 5'-triphosphate deaminase [Terriglobia bacterium]